jgi:hypothetical protein
MHKALGVLLVLIGVIFIFKATFFILVITAIGLGLAAAAGAIGRWGYTVAAILLLLMVPVLIFKTLVATIFLAFHLLPLILVCLGVYLVFKAVSH